MGEKTDSSQHIRALANESGGGVETSSLGDDKKFDDCFKVLWKQLEDENRVFDDPLSFRKSNNVICQEEWYKYRIRKEIQARIRCIPFDDLKRIAEETEVCLITAGQMTGGGNLLVWSHVDIASAKCKSRTLYRSAGSIVRDVLTSRSEAEMKSAFEKAASFFTKDGAPMYDIISFLFFMKDCMNDGDSFFSVRPLSYGERLYFLGYDRECTRKCTWENYCRYLECLKDIRIRLSKYLECNELTLIDAESFMWMLWKVTRSPNDFQNRLKKLESYPLPEDPLESRVICSRPEGTKVQYYVTKYERDPKLRRQCIALNYRDGKYPSCIGCGFNFGDIYGDHGRDYIEVHHIVPLSSKEETVDVNPETDLVCVCANCHRMIHHKRNHVLTIEELQSFIQRSKTSPSPNTT